MLKPWLGLADFPTRQQRIGAKRSAYLSRRIHGWPNKPENLATYRFYPGLDHIDGTKRTYLRNQGARVTSWNLFGKPWRNGRPKSLGYAVIGA